MDTVQDWQASNRKQMNFPQWFINLSPESKLKLAADLRTLVWNKYPNTQFSWVFNKDGHKVGYCIVDFALELNQKLDIRSRQRRPHVMGPVHPYTDCVPWGLTNEDPEACCIWWAWGCVLSHYIIHAGGTNPKDWELGARQEAIKELVKIQ
jgi:hypothetical protein